MVITFAYDKSFWLVDKDQKGWEGRMIVGRMVKVPHASSVGHVSGLNVQRYVKFIHKA
jgi:hypothetical protein